MSTAKHKVLSSSLPTLHGSQTTPHEPERACIPSTPTFQRAHTSNHHTPTVPLRSSSPDWTNSVPSASFCSASSSIPVASRINHHTMSPQCDAHQPPLNSRRQPPRSTPSTLHGNKESVTQKREASPIRRGPSSSHRMLTFQAIAPQKVMDGDASGRRSKTSGSENRQTKKMLPRRSDRPRRGKGSDSSSSSQRHGARRRTGGTQNKVRHDAFTTPMRSSESSCSTSTSSSIMMTSTMLRHSVDALHHPYRPRGACGTSGHSIQSRHPVTSSDVTDVAGSSLTQLMGMEDDGGGTTEKETTKKKQKKGGTSPAMIPASAPPPVETSSCLPISNALMPQSSCLDPHHLRDMFTLLRQVSLPTAKRLCTAASQRVCISAGALLFSGSSSLSPTAHQPAVTSVAVVVRGDVVIQLNGGHGMSHSVAADLLLHFVQAATGSVGEEQVATQLKSLLRGRGPRCSGGIPALHVAAPVIMNLLNVVGPGGARWTGGSAQDRFLVSAHSECEVHWIPEQEVVSMDAAELATIRRQEVQLQTLLMGPLSTRDVVRAVVGPVVRAAGGEALEAALIRSGDASGLPTGQRPLALQRHQQVRFETSRDNATSCAALLILEGDIDGGTSACLDPGNAAWMWPDLLTILTAPDGLVMRRSVASPQLRAMCLRRCDIVRWLCSAALPASFIDQLGDALARQLSTRPSNMETIELHANPLALGDGCPAEKARYSALISRLRAIRTPRAPLVAAAAVKRPTCSGTLETGNDVGMESAAFSPHPPQRGRGIFSPSVSGVDWFDVMPLLPRSTAMEDADLHHDDNGSSSSAMDFSSQYFPSGIRSVIPQATE